MDGTYYGSRYYALQSSTYATNSANSASSASTYASNADASALDADNYAQSAKSSASAAASSASAAAESASTWNSVNPVFSTSVTSNLVYATTRLLVAGVTDDGSTSIQTSGATSVGGLGTFKKGISVTGGITTDTVAAGSLSSDAYDAEGANLRIINDDYGVIFRNDGSSFWMLQTASGSAEGTYNAYRPFQWNLSTGALTFDNTGAGSVFGGPIKTSSTLTSTGNATVGGTLTVTGATALESNLGVAGTVGMDSTLTVAGATLLQSSLTVDGVLDVANAVNMTGANVMLQTPAYNGSPTTAEACGVLVRNVSGSGDGYNAAMSWLCQGTFGLQMTLRSDGVFGIGGWSAPSYCWYVATASGTMVASGNVSAYSDPRLKKDFRPIVNALDQVCQLRGMHFTWRDYEFLGRKNTADIGLVSTDVRKVVPSAVTEVEMGGNTYDVVSYEKMVPLLIEAVKELRAEVEALKWKKSWYKRLFKRKEVAA